jgi:membrane protein YdbS with pleckstrin-like domain
MENKTRDRYPLSQKKIIKKSIGKIIGYLIFALLVSGTLAIMEFAIKNDGAEKALIQTINNGLFVWINVAMYALVIPYAVLVVLYQYWYFKVYYYELEPDYIVIRKHPITPKEITIPYERIQDVYVDQDILDRIFGIYDVHLSSATISSGMEAHIDGLGKDAADGLRAELLKTVSEKISRQKLNQGPQVS